MDTDTDTHSGDGAEPSAAAKLREEIAGAAAMSNTEAHPSLDLQVAASMRWIARRCSSIPR